MCDGERRGTVSDNRLAGEVLQHAATVEKVLAELIRSKALEHPVLHAVRGDLVAGGGNSAYDVGLVLRHPAEDEERGRGLMVGQGLEDAIDRQGKTCREPLPILAPDAGLGGRLNLKVLFDVETQEVHHVPRTRKGLDMLLGRGHGCSSPFEFGEGFAGKAYRLGGALGNVLASRFEPLAEVHCGLEVPPGQPRVAGLVFGQSKVVVDFR